MVCRLNPATGRYTAFLITSFLFVIPLFVLHLLRAVAVLSLQAKGCEGVTRNEKEKVMKGLARIAEMLPAAKKQYILGYAEGMTYRKEVKK